MKKELSEKVDKLIAWVIFLSIVGIFLTSLIPWISVNETEPVVGELHFNFEMMKKRNNNNMQTLSERIQLINTSFFLLLIFSILAYIGNTIFKSKKFVLFSLILMIIGGSAIVVLSVLIVQANYNYIKTVDDLVDTSIPTIITHFKYAYFPLIIGVSSLIISTFFEWNITSFIVSNIKESKIQRKYMEDEELLDKTSEKDEDISQKEPLFIKDKPDLNAKSADDHKDIEDWLKNEVENIESPKEKPIDEILKPDTKEQIENKPIIEEEIEEDLPISEEDDFENNEQIIEEKVEKPEIEPIPLTDESIDDLEKEETYSKEDNIDRIPTQKENIESKKEVYEYPIASDKTEEDKTLIDKKEKIEQNEEIIDEPSRETEAEPVQTKKPIVEPFKSKEKKEESSIPKTPADTISFENVLSSAIEKRQVDKIKKESKEETSEEDEYEDDETEEEKVTLTVRCPGCKHVFTVEKTGEVTNIKCPECGKKGIVK